MGIISSLPHTLIVSGETEFLFDDIQKLCQNMKEVVPGFKEVGMLTFIVGRGIRL